MDNSKLKGRMSGKVQELQKPMEVVNTDADTALAPVNSDYYDREYRRQGIGITPPMLISCFFPYTKKGILDLLNHEICCDFTHMLVTEGLDLDSNTAPLCGAI